MVTQRTFKAFIRKLKYSFPRWVLTEDYHHIWCPSFMKHPTEGFYHSNFTLAKGKDLRAIEKAILSYNKQCRKVN